MNCLDAETLAAWFDGGLSGAALEDIRSHVAGCGRCQALVGAMGRTRVAAPPQPERSPRWWLAWAVPAAAAATAVAIWVLVPQPTNVAVTPSATSSLQKQEAQPQTPPPAATAAAPAEPAAPPARAAAPTLQDRARSADAAPPAAAPASENDVAKQPAGNVNETLSVRSAAPPTAAAERREEAERKGAIVGQLQARDAFAMSPCGPRWPAPPSDLGGQVTGGSAPSDTVCWMIGRAGTVLRSTDHQTWQRVNFPVPVDLSSVNATDPRTATVVTVDGRTFSTTDGGVTWTPR